MASLASEAISSCVPADEPVNHHIDHEIKFSLLPPAEHVDHFPQHNHQVLNFILRQIFDSLSTLKGHGKVAVRSIALEMSSEAIAGGTRPASSFTFSPSCYPV